MIRNPESFRRVSAQVRSRLNTLESEVKLVINALGIDTVSRLLDNEEK